MSAKYFTIDYDDLRRSTTEHTECLEPDSAGYTDENGVEHLVKIPRGRLTEITEAVERGDTKKLKALGGL